MSKQRKHEGLESVPDILSESEEVRLQQNTAVTERRPQASSEGVHLPEVPSASAPYGYDVNGEPIKRPQHSDIERASLIRVDAGSRCQAHGIPDCSVCAALKKSVALARLSARNLPIAVVGVEYCQPIRFVSESPIKPPYSWTMTSGSSLPDGLKLGDDDMIRGVPTTEGITQFTAIAEDSSDPPQYLLQRFCLRVTVPQQPIVPAPVPAPADVQPTVLPTLTDADARKALGIKEPLPEPRFMRVWRTFYHVPRKPEQDRNWKPDLDGLTPANIAAFLMMPEVLYSDYEQNKNNPPRTMFRTPEIAYDTTSFKGGAKRKASWLAHKLTRRAADGNAPVGVVEIIDPNEYWNVYMDPVPPKRVLRKLPVPENLTVALANAKTERHRLQKSEQRKLAPEERYHSDSELRVQQRKFDRKIEALEAETEDWKKNRWGWVDEPATGLRSMKITLPPCPEGSECVFPIGLVKRYLKNAWAETYGLGSQRRQPVPLSNQKISWWDFRWLDFENKVINRAARLRIFECAPPTANEHAMATISNQRLLDTHEQALAEDARRQDDGDINELRARWLADNAAKDNAARNYRGEEGRALDPTIGRVKPQGQGPKSDEYDHWQ